MPQGEPKSGEKYLHFKNKLYQVITVAQHSETGEKLVIYQALYGEYGIYARPLSMFVSLTEQDKYPEVRQKYRFQLVEQENVQQTEKPGKENSPQPVISMDQEEKEVSELLMDFYDAKTYEEKYSILTEMREGITDVMINNMAVVLDIVIPEGSLDKRYEELKRCLRTYQKYETSRLH